MIKLILKSFKNLPEFTYLQTQSWVEKIIVAKQLISNSPASTLENYIRTSIAVEGEKARKIHELERQL